MVKEAPIQKAGAPEPAAVSHAFSGYPGWGKVEAR